MEKVKQIELLEDFIFSVIDTENLPNILETSFWSSLLSDVLWGSKWNLIQIGKKYILKHEVWGGCEVSSIYSGISKLLKRVLKVVGRSH